MSKPIKKYCNCKAGTCEGTYSIRRCAFKTVPQEPSIPISKLEEFIKCVNTSILENLHCWSSSGKQSVIDDLQKLIDDAKNG